MLLAPTPANESERLASLRKMQLLSTPDEAAFDRITRIGQRLFNVPIVLISLIDAHRQWFKSCIGLPVRETGREISFCGHAIMAREIFVIEDALADERFADNPLVTGEPHVIFYAGRPLSNSEGYLVGTLCLIDHHPRQFSQADRNALDDLGHWVQQVFLGRELSELQETTFAELEEARRSSMLDPMLNIWHKGAALDMLNREVLRTFRNKSPLAVMMVDVDHFKSINDKLGHLVGDQVLIEFARSLRSATRTYDTVGRYGGDEFIIILPDTHVVLAESIAERILLTLSTQPFLAGEEIINLTASIGIAVADFVNDTPEPSELIRRADVALLKAKRAGRAGFQRFVD